MDDEETQPTADDVVETQAAGDGGAALPEAVGRRLEERIATRREDREFAERLDASVTRHQDILDLLGR